MNVRTRRSYIAVGTWPPWLGTHHHR